MNRREELENNLNVVARAISSYNPTLIVVTKTYPVSDVEILYQLGVRDFGENRDEEGAEKSSRVAGTWHYQGEIQSKKIRSIASWASTIHSLDELRHIEKFNRVAGELGKTLNVFIQLSLDGDPHRGGVLEENVQALATAAEDAENLNLMGLMCVPPVEADPESAYREISEIHQRFIAKYPAARSLSAGMSGDYLLALQHGATHIRVGSSILGQRQYR